MMQYARFLETVGLLINVKMLRNYLQYAELIEKV